MTTCSIIFREAKFKRALRVYFLTHFTKKLLPLSHTQKVKSGTDIWSTHQSKALLFYFGIKKFLSLSFENFVENRQTQFHILKFRVCKHTLNLNSWNVLCLFPTKFSKIQLKKFFVCQNRKSELSIDICVTFNFRCEKAAKVFL